MNIKIIIKGISMLIILLLILLTDVFSDNKSYIFIDKFDRDVINSYFPGTRLFGVFAESFFRAESSFLIFTFHQMIYIFTLIISVVFILLVRKGNFNYEKI